MLDFRKNKEGNTTEVPKSQPPVIDQEIFQNISREEVIIRRIFDDSILQNKILKHLDPILFADPVHASLCTAMLKGYEKYKKFPQAEELSLALPDNSVEKNKLSKIMNLKIKKIDRAIVIDVIENFFKQKKTEKVLENAAEAIYTKNFDDIAGLVKDLEQAVNFSLYLDIGLNLVKDVDEALRRLNETFKPIPSALSDIRAWTMQGKGTGGWYRGLSVFMGMPNVGKTILLCNEAAYSFQNGYNVLYVTMEMEEALIWERIAVNVTDIPLNKIRSQPKEDIERLMRERKLPGVEKSGELFVRELPSTSTPMDIENLIEEIRLSEGIDIDICIVDYIQLLKPILRKSSINYRNATLYSLGKEIAEQLRDLSRKIKIPFLTASQLNKEGYSNTQADMRNTAGSSGLNDTADLIVTIASDPYLEKCSLFLHTIIKNRFGAKMVTFLSECNIMNMRVRAASNTVRKKYSESQLNQNIEIVNFNRKPNEENGEIPIKTSEEIEKEKKEEEISRFKKIEHGIIRQEREKARGNSAQSMRQNFMDEARRRKEENKENGV